MKDKNMFYNTFSHFLLFNIKNNFKNFEKLL